MKISIKDGNEDHSSIISKIYADSWRVAYKGMVPAEYLKNLKDDFWTDNFKKWIQDNVVKVKIIYLDDKAVGAAAYGKSRDEKYLDYAEIWSFYLLPEHFRKGLGTALMKSVIREVCEEGYDKCYLWVLDQNKNARTFYEKLGFSCTDDKCYCSIMNKELCDIRYILDLKWKPIV